MKVLTIHQPWASAIAAGQKTIENRTWRTSYRGPLLIHAGRSLKSMDFGRAFLDRLGIELPTTLPLGSIVALAELVDCRPLGDLEDPFAEGPVCWMLQNIRALEPLFWPGGQGLFELPAAAIARLRFMDGSRVVRVELPSPSWTPGILPLN